MATQTIERKPKVESEVTRMERTRSGLVFRPNVDILEQGDELTLFADMPGVRPGDIDVNFENGTLTIYGRVPQRQGEETTYLRAEYGIGDFYREFQVSETIDANRISAECRHGVLTVHLPKVDAARPRKIEVRSS